MAWNTLHPPATLFVCLTFETTVDDQSSPDTLILFGLRTLRFRFFSMASASGSTQAPAQAGKSTQPLVAQGDWTKNLVQLAKTAELK
jgi:hypothetical protein